MFSYLHVFRLTFAMYGGLNTKCMEAGNLSKLAISLHPDAVAKLRAGVGHKYRVRRAGGGVRHAAAPRKRRFRCLVRTHKGRRVNPAVFASFRCA